MGIVRQPLTKRQREIYDYIAATIDEHGYAPSLAEICAYAGLSSLSTAHKHVERLRALGYVTRQWGRSRQMAIAPEPDCCQTCGRAFAVSAKAS